MSLLAFILVSFSFVLMIFFFFQQKTALEIVM